MTKLDSVYIYMFMRTFWILGFFGDKFKDLMI